MNNKETAKNHVVNTNDLPELLGQIIDTFEDFLEEKGIDIPNEDKKESESPAIIYDSDYGYLQEKIENILINWGIVKLP